MTHIKKGKLIVIEGNDGSGKTVQAELLVKYFKNNKIPVKYFDFPQYYKTFYGKTVAQFLRGEFGNIDEVSPYFASLIYALDRATVKEEIDKFIKQGGYVVANRYIQSNMAHQGTKFRDLNEREKFLEWVYELEYKVNKMPKEDIVIYLYVPWKISKKLIKEKKERDYLQGKKDIHEKNTTHLRETEKMYLFLSKKNKNWIKIECIENGKLLDIDTMNKKIVSALGCSDTTEFDNKTKTIL